MVSRPAAGIAALAIIAAAAGVMVWLGSEPGLSARHDGSAPVAGPSQDSLEPAPGATGGTAGATAAALPAVSAQDAVSALCQVRATQIAGLLAGTTGTARFEALREAVPVLGERVLDVQDAADHRPAIEPVLATVRAVHQDWAIALTAYDGRQTATARAALDRATGRIATLNLTLRTALPASARCA